MGRTFIGFGFGAIQAGLFLYEAFRSGTFTRLCVAEVMDDVVAAVRRRGAYRVNIATRDGVRQHEVPGVEIFNPLASDDRAELVNVVCEAAEIATALPSVEFYGGESESDVVVILAEGLGRKGDAGGPDAVIYTAENNNRAAEILAAGLDGRVSASARERYQCLNTVIGKMSGVVKGGSNMQRRGLACAAEGLDRAFLVEEFNRILVTSVRLQGFRRGIEVFEEKPDLLPFEEAKLYGHNATHALLGYLLRLRGVECMADAGRDGKLMRFVREAFIEDSGRALCRRHRGVDRLFTEAGYAEYVDDLLERMLNPHLGDSVERVTRDPRRKLGWHDRLVGTMRIGLEHGVRPARYAVGAAAALRGLREAERKDAGALLDEVWSDACAPDDEKREVKELILDADPEGVPSASAVWRPARGALRVGG